MSPKNTVNTPEREIEKYATCKTWIEAIVGGSPIPQFVIDRDHKVLFWSEALEKYSGIKSNEVVGTNRQWKAFYPKKRPTLPDLLIDGEEDRIPELYEGKYDKSQFIEAFLAIQSLVKALGPLPSARKRKTSCTSPCCSGGMNKSQTDLPITSSRR